MNIKFGMDNYYVRYLKRFLNHELGISNRILGDFDKNDQKALITYLNLPNVKDMFEVESEIQTLFPELSTLFTIVLKDNELQFTSKEISKESSDFIKHNLNNIITYCKSVGWEVSDVNQWINESFDINKDDIINNVDLGIISDIMNNEGSYSQEIEQAADINLDGEVNELDYNILEEYLNNNKLYITLKQSNRKNYFPNEDMKVFINQFDGTFMYNYAIRSEDGTEDKPHTAENYKIGLYLCKPNQKVTIAHNSPDTQRLVIGCSKSTLLENVENDFLENVVDIQLKPGEGYEYTCTNNAVRLCIQCASSYKDLEEYVTRTITLKRGDVNLDGKIDMEDYALLADYTAEGPGADKLPFNKANWTPSARQLAVMDIPIPDGSGSGIAGVDGKITRADAIELYRFITGQSTQTSLGLVAYEYTLNDQSKETTNNVEHLLIIDGHYDKSVNIPFSEFTQDAWIIHEKFFNYLLNMAIHKYSNSDDITYLQKLIMATKSSGYYSSNYFYPGDYDKQMQNAVLEFQKSNSTYTVGDLNRDGKLDQIDLALEREIIECLNADINGDGKIDQTDFDLLSSYLQGVAQLTEEQLEKADVNFDGVIDYLDLAIIQEFIDGTRQNIMEINNQNRNRVLTQKIRADINKDGKWNGNDYTALENEINGVTNNLVDYTIPFMLGWCDVQTEAILEQMYNQYENISEVSK